MVPDPFCESWFTPLASLRRVRHVCQTKDGLEGRMGSFSIWHWLVVLMVVLLLFGSGKVSNLMGDFAKGIKSFKKNMADEETDASMAATAEKPAGTIPAPGATTTATNTTAVHHS
jgi:sec-independent protein translocase protein TatA